MTGYISYRGYAAMQHADAVLVFSDFIREVRPERILEIGTAHGGLTLAMRDLLNEAGLSASAVRSFDVVDRLWYDTIRSYNIEIIVDNVFAPHFVELTKPELIQPFIQGEGTTVVLCDGGYKIREFNLIAPYLKVGDYIMAHDYVDTEENFRNNFFDKIWNWQEIKESDIQVACDQHQLADCHKAAFNAVAWVCKKRLA